MNQQKIRKELETMIEKARFDYPSGTISKIAEEVAKSILSRFTLTPKVKEGCLGQPQDHIGNQGSSIYNRCGKDVHSDELPEIKPLDIIPDSEMWACRDLWDKVGELISAYSLIRERLK